MAAVAGTAGGIVASGTLAGDAGRLLVTFLGLVSASILPTVSLILGSMTASSRSVKALNELQVELSAAVDALLLLFGLVAVAVLLLLLLAIPLPASVTNLKYVGHVPSQLLQSMTAAVVSLVFMRAGQIPGILRRTLVLRHRIAVDEARRETIERAPKPGEISSVFATHPDFGKHVSTDEGEGRDPH